jgi:hypothetical protein
MSDKKPKVGTIGIVIGSVSLLLALFHFYAGPFSPQPKFEQTIAEKAVAIRDATVAALRGNEIQKETWTSKWDTDKLLDVVTALLGGLAIIAGILAFARKESIRFAGGAAVLGGGAIAFQFAALALGAIVVAIILAAVLSQLDFF